MPEEHPPLGKPFILQYEESSLSYPVLAVLKDLRAGGYQLPTINTQEGLWSDWQTKYPNNKFTEVQRIDEQRVLWIYRILPGPAVTSKPVYDAESGVFITVTKQRKALSAITEGIDHQNDTSVTIVTKEAIDSYQGYEVTKVIPMSVHQDSATAKVSFEVKPYQFPGWIFVEALDAYGTAIGYRKTYSETVNHIIRTWWVIKDTAPLLVYDEITPGDIVINDVSYKNVLHDETTRLYAGSSVTIPATTPPFTEYYGTADVMDPFAPGSAPKWIGNEKIIGGSVEPDGADRFRFKITTISVVMQ